MNKRAVALLVSAAMLLPAAANAACKQDDLAGTWQFYQAFGPVWYRCVLVVKSGGAVENANCRSSINQTSSLMTQAHFDLISEPHCVFTAQFRLDNGSHQINHAALSRDKLTASGVGMLNEAIAFSVTMVKR